MHDIASQLDEVPQARGSAPVATPAWGDDAASDAARLRALRDAPAARVGWHRFFAWAGERLALPFERRLPPEALPAAVTAVAAARGLRLAFDVLLPHAQKAGRGSGLRSLARTFALRCALEGTLRPAMARSFSWRPSRKEAGAHPGRRWLLDVLAWHAARDAEAAAGFVHLTAALVSHDLCARLRHLLGPVAPRPAVASASWRDRPLHGTVVELLRTGCGLRAQLPPWHEVGGGPHALGVVGALERILDKPWLAAELFLDPRLAVAAIYALLGYGPSAHAQAAGASVHPHLVSARDALLRAIASCPARPRAGSGVPALPLGGDAQRLLGRLRATPDPSLELGSPFWLVPDRGPLLSSLLREGRRTAASAVRSVLDRPDLRADVAPFWLMQGTEDDTASTLALARWMAGAA